MTLPSLWKGQLWGEGKNKHERTHTPLEEGTRLLDKPFLEPGHREGRISMTS